MDSNTEIEAKFDADAGWKLPEFADLATRKVPKTELVAVYWDTEDRRLDQLGVTLRRRVADGKKSEWTAKLPLPGSAAGTQHRQEVTVRSKGTSVPTDLLDLLTAITRGSELEPLAELRTRRRRRRVGNDRWSDAVEVTDDRVTSTLAGHVGPSFRQIEVELLDDDAGDVMDQVVDALRGSGLEPSTDASKLRRVLGSPAPGLVERGTSSTVGELVAAAIGRCRSEMVRADPWIRLDDDADVVHSCRKAIRRLRSDLKSLRPVLDRTLTDPLRDELRWYGGLLGAVRDRHVMGAHVLDVADEIGIAAGGLDAVVEVLEAQGEIERRSLLSAMRGDRYLRLLDALSEYELEVPLKSGVDADRSSRKVVAMSGRSALKKVERARRRATRRPDAENLHTMRKKVKDVRATGQLAKDAGAKSKKFVATAGTLKEDLGDLHDADVLVAWLDEHSGRLDPDVAYRAGRVRERTMQRRAELASAWPEAWEHLDRVRLRRWMK